jgi:hypothetical protein
MQTERTISPAQSPVVEIIDRTDKFGSALESAGKALRVISASEAFRKFDWLRGRPVMNGVGDLRGMVVNGRWRVVFEQTSTGLELLGKITLLAGFAANLAEQSKKIQDVLGSRDPDGIKALQLASIAGTAAERTLAGGATGLISLSLLSMQGYCRAAGLLGGGAAAFSTSCVTSLRNADNFVQSTVRTWTDTNRQGEAIIWVASKIGVL